MTTPPNTKGFIAAERSGYGVTVDDGVTPAEPAIATLVEQARLGRRPLASMSGMVPAMLTMDDVDVLAVPNGVSELLVREHSLIRGLRAIRGQEGHAELPRITRSSRITCQSPLVSPGSQN